LKQPLHKEFLRRHDLVLETLEPLNQAAKDQGGKFVFAGGSAVQTLLPRPPRLSIDLDAYTNIEPAELVKSLSPSHVIAPKKSSLPGYSFFNATKGTTTIRLDLTTTPLPKGAETEKRITLKGSAFNISIASPHYLFASKLTALSIGTIGRKLDNQTSFIKDFYDDNSIQEQYGVPVLAWHHFESCTKSENNLRGTDYSPKEVAVAAINALKRGAPLYPDSPTTKGAIDDFGQLLLEGKVDKPTLSAMSLRIAAYLNAYLSTGATRAEEEIKRLEEDVTANSHQTRAVNAYEAELGKKENRRFLRELKFFAPKALAYLYSIRDI
jgi:hypothetical protein